MGSPDPILTRVRDKQSWGGGVRPTPGKDTVRLRHSLLCPPGGDSPVVDRVCGLNVTTPPCIEFFPMGLALPSATRTKYISLPFDFGSEHVTCCG